jgi:hypothetical protein
MESETELPFGPGLTSGVIAVVVGLIPGFAALAILPAIVSLIGSIRTLSSPRAPASAAPRVGLALGCLGLVLGVVAVVDLGEQATLWNLELPVDTCSVSPFC